MGSSALVAEGACVITIGVEEVLVELSAVAELATD